MKGGVSQVVDTNPGVNFMKFVDIKHKLIPNLMIHASINWNYFAYHKDSTVMQNCCVGALRWSRTPTRELLVIPH